MGKAGTSSAAQPSAGRVGPSDAAGLPRGADLVLLHGKIWTGEPYAGPGQKPVPAAFVEAVAMASGRILAVGRSDEIRSYAGPNTRVVDLEGRFAVPGFIVDHVHFLAGVFQLVQVNLIVARDEEEFVRRLALHGST